jgi:hypothetical protein
LKCCDFIKHCKPQAAAGERISFKANSFMTAKNIEELITVIQDVKHLDTIKNDAKCLELFQLANFLQAPENVLAPLANRLYPQVQKQIENLEQEIEKIKEDKNNNALEDKNEILSDLLLLKDTLAIQLPYYPDFKAFLADLPKNKDGKPDFHSILSRDENTLNLNMHLLAAMERKKKIGSFDGIEQLTQYPWTQKITFLHCDDQQIKTFSVKELKKTFPQLQRISLPFNCIESISNKEIDDTLTLINLAFNNTKSCCIENPEQFKCLTISASGTPLQAKDIQFKQTSAAKILFWLKSLVAKSNIVAFKSCNNYLFAWGAWSAGSLMVFMYVYFKYGKVKVFEKAKLWGGKMDFFSLLLMPYLVERVTSLYEGRIKTNLENAASQNPYHVRVITPSNWGLGPDQTEFPTKYSYKLW